MARRVHKLFTVATEPTCPACAFALNGLAEQGQCPECGSAYDATTRWRLLPPTPLRAIAHFAGPLAAGVLACGATIAAAIAMNSEFWSPAAITFGGVALFSMLAWSAWRFVVLLNALQDAMPTQQQDRHRTKLVGCIGSGLGGVVAVVAFSLAVLLSIMLGSCLLEAWQFTPAGVS